MDVCSYERLVSGKLRLAFESVVRPGIALPMVSAHRNSSLTIQGPSSGMSAEVII